jgi:hypothetical protein
MLNTFQKNVVFYIFIRPFIALRSVPNIKSAEEHLEKAEPRLRTAIIVLYADPSNPLGQIHAVKTSKGRSCI